MQITDVPLELFEAIWQAAEGDRVALVGGVVRESFLHGKEDAQRSYLADIDLIVEGRTEEFTTRLEKVLRVKHLDSISITKTRSSKYLTESLLVREGEKGWLWQIDIASARRETYSHPGSEPTVTPCIIEEDLLRRDFTINAIALEFLKFNKRHYRVIDLHNGVVDLKNKRLRFLHDQSVEEDPTRIIRAVRYAASLSFEISEDSLSQIQKALNTWPWSTKLNSTNEKVPASLGTRMRKEIERMLNNDKWPEAVELLGKLGGFRLVDEKLNETIIWKSRLRWSKRLDLPMIVCLVANSSDPAKLGSRLQLPKRYIDSLKKMEMLNAILAKDIAYKNAFEFCEMLDENKIEHTSVSLSIISGSQRRKLLLDWIFKWRLIKPQIRGADLINEGWKPGPALGKELKRLRDEKLLNIPIG